MTTPNGGVERVFPTGPTPLVVLDTTTVEVFNEREEKVEVTAYRIQGRAGVNVVPSNVTGNLEIERAIGNYNARER